MFFGRRNLQSTVVLSERFYFDNYRILFILILLVVLLALVIFTVITVINKRFWVISQTHSIYECGFLPFEEARIRFEPKFYMIALSFIIFDLEICFIFPWLLIYQYMPVYSLFLFFIFLIFILVGLVFEWRMGIFDWSEYGRDN
jgi:NADH:ubiquinone oxidoreductase subunit 3 (subunit A)